MPRTEVDFLDASMPVYSAAREALTKPHSRYPVIRGSSDDVIGFVHVRDLLDPDMANRSVRVGELARDVLTLPWTRNIIAALGDMRREGIHMAMVADEYGGTAGIVTMEDLVEEVVGDIRDEYDVDEGETTRHLSGDIEVDGLLNLDDFEDETGVELTEGPYETVAGFLMSQLGRIPEAGDAVDHEGYRITVVLVDGRRVSRVRVGPLPTPVPDDAGPASQHVADPAGTDRGRRPRAPVRPDDGSAVRRSVDRGARARPRRVVGGGSAAKAVLPQDVVGDLVDGAQHVARPASQPEHQRHHADDCQPGGESPAGRRRRGSELRVTRAVTRSRIAMARKAVHHHPTSPPWSPLGRVQDARRRRTYW